MLLFKHYHVPFILNGTKTATRRIWKKPRVKVGSIHQCKTGYYKKDYFSKIRIIKLYQQSLRDMKDVDYKREGGYTRESFIEAWMKINGCYTPDEIVYVVEFELVKEEI